MLCQPILFPSTLLGPRVGISLEQETPVLPGPTRTLASSSGVMSADGRLCPQGCRTVGCEADWDMMGVRLYGTEQQR